MGFLPSLSHTPRAIAACQRAKQASKTVQFTPHSTHTILNPGSERKQPASPPGSSGQEVRSLQVPGNIGFRGLGTRPPEPGGTGRSCSPDLHAAAGVSGLWVSFIAGRKRCTMESVMSLKMRSVEHTLHL